MSNRPILFYSTHCNHCSQLIRDLQQTQLHQKIHMVCVDHSRDKLPSFVRSVPTLVLGPSTHPLVGDHAFAWFEQQIQGVRGGSTSLPQQHAPMQSPEPPKTAASPPTASTDPAGWQCHEMGNSLSDSYSFINTSETQNGTIPKNFEFISQSSVDVTNPFPQAEQQSPPTRSPMPSGGGSIPGSPNFAMTPPQNCPATDELSARMEKLQSQREFDTPQPPQRIS